VRVVRACRERGISSVAVYSDADRDALHVRSADEAYRIGAAPASESYLHGARILDAAREAGADAVHPGYGFLAENAAFAQACLDAGLIFIGPRPETIALMGEKTSARREAVAAGVPVVPGTLEPIADEKVLRAEAERIGFPVMLKAAGGGGGKGIRRVESAADLASAVERARREAQSTFGTDAVYLEKAIDTPRHVEIQVLGDTHGNAIHLYERECSIQRRHQKLIEESPSPLLTPELRARMGEFAVALVKRTGYVNAGTVEFLVDANRNPYFLEMNARLQVEHPVTELVTGIDLVAQQLSIAAGDALGLVQEQIQQRGHAIECRVYAEDPSRGFLPSPGRIAALQTPGGPGVRDDSGVYDGYTVPIHYDPLLSKLCCHAATRPEAIARMQRAIAEYKVVGISTTLPFFAWALRTQPFVEGDYDTGFVDAHYTLPPAPGTDAEIAIIAASIQAHRDRVRDRTTSDETTGSAWWRAGLAVAHGSRP
jgi:acetyl-CoA carboxylase biotin carboxylase subunit